MERAGRRFRCRRAANVRVRPIPEPRLRRVWLVPGPLRPEFPADDGFHVVTSPVSGFLETTMRFIIANAGFTTAGGRPCTEGEAAYRSAGARHDDYPLRRRRYISFTDRTILVAKHLSASSDGVQHVPVRVPAIPALEPVSVM
jgi:hypothetical protein